MRLYFNRCPRGEQGVAPRWGMGFLCERKTYENSPFARIGIGDVAERSWSRCMPEQKRSPRSVVSDLWEKALLKASFKTGSRP